MKWSELSKKVQTLAIITGSVTALAATAYGAYSHFQTDAEANASHSAIRTVVAQNQQQQIDVFKEDRLDRHQREISRIEYQLLSDELTDKQREYLKRKIEELRELIKCIRQDKC